MANIEPPKKKLLATMAHALGFGEDKAVSVATSTFEYGETLTTVALSGNGIDGARNRTLIYLKYQQMMATPLVAGALRQHVTAALGGHETTGDLVFLETKADAKKDARMEKLVTELAADLLPMFNRIAMRTAYHAVGYGDGYARLYTKKGVGVISIVSDEMLLPPLVIPYEQGEKTVACVVATGPNQHSQLNMLQIARLKMQRLLYTPQPLANEKAMRTALEEDDPDKMPIMPSLAGGSFLADAEDQYNKFMLALVGLVGQRALDSIDETVFTADMGDMTVEQRKSFKDNIKKMLERSKEIADKVAREQTPLLRRIRHFLPTFSNGKQAMQIQALNSGGGTGAGRSGNYTIEDVMFHAKMLCGGLGIDISQLGFADVLSGGLGEGGFFRNSVQSAERSRVIRAALTDFFNHIIDVHLMVKYGRTFLPAERPWQISFYGTISAMESERTKTQLDAANTGMVLAQLFAMLKDAGLQEEAMQHFMEKVLRMDVEDAKIYAKDIAEAAKKAQQEQQGGFGGDGGGFGGGGGGGFGGGSDGGQKGDAYGEQQ